MKKADTELSVVGFLVVQKNILLMGGRFDFHFFWAQLPRQVGMASGLCILRLIEPALTSRSDHILLMYTTAERFAVNSFGQLFNPSPLGITRRLASSEGVPPSPLTLFAKIERANLNKAGGNELAELFGLLVATWQEG